MRQFGRGRPVLWDQYNDYKDGRNTKINIWKDVAAANDNINTSRAQNSWYFGSKCYHVFSFAAGILMW